MLNEQDIYLFGQIQTSQTGGHLYRVILSLLKYVSILCSVCTKLEEYLSIPGHS